MSLGRTRWPHRRPTGENILMGKWTNGWQQHRPRMWIPFRQVSVKGSRHTRMVHDIEPQTGSHTMKICVVANTTLQLLLLEWNSHIRFTHDGFTVQGFADGRIVLIGNHYGREDLSSKRYSAKTWVLDFLKEMIAFLQPVTVGISGVTGEEQQMSTRDRNTTGTVSSTQILKRWLLTEDIFHICVTVLYSKDINSCKINPPINRKLD